MRARHALFLIVAALVAVRPAGAQTAAEQEVRQVVDRMFNGMRTGDTTMVRAAFHPQARLQSTSLRQGVPTLRTDSIDAFIRFIGVPHAEVYDERISNVQIRVDGELATAWMDYAFYRGTRFSHCGVNAFQFFRAPAGWQIIQITDTRRPSCPRAGTPPA
ncbi:MAG TPA: nuclear transport factor 2 family protein [Longimicrobium sp.]|nr:nuclear transport factor 2 family protein [Longimicrobium sp.]